MLNLKQANFVVHNFTFEYLVKNCIGLFNQNKINRAVAEHKEGLPKKYSANSDKVFGSCGQFCASMELTEGIDFSKSVFFGFCEVMFWMILQSHRVH